jgi:hypothetical protein
VGLRNHEGGWGSQVPFEFFKGLLHLFGPLELVFLFEELEGREPPDASLDMNLLKCAMHPINLCTSWRLLGGFIIVIADTFSGLGSIHVGNTYTQVVFLRVDQMYTSQDSTSC